MSFMSIDSYFSPIRENSTGKDLEELTKILAMFPQNGFVLLEENTEDPASGDNEIQAALYNQFVQTTAMYTWEVVHTGPQYMVSQLSGDQYFIFNDVPGEGAYPYKVIIVPLG